MHCNNGLNNKLVETLVENKVTEETGDLRYLQDSMHNFVSTLKEIILGEYSPEFFNRYVDEALKLHGSNLDEFLKIPKMGLELRQALNSIDEAIDTSNQEFKDNLVLLLDKFQTTLDNMEYEARDPYDTAVELGFQGTKQEWLDHLEGDSAYKIATLNGFGGTEEEWLDHLEGDSAYEIAVNTGYEGTQDEWLKYIRADGFIQSIQQFATNDAETEVQIPDYGTINSLQGYISTMFENGGLPATPFATKALMTASALVDGDYAAVTHDDTANNGLYVKTAGAWVESGYDPLEQAKAYADSNPLFKPKMLIATDDLDTLETGIYYSRVSGYADDIANMPPFISPIKLGTVICYKEGTIAYQRAMHYKFLETWERVGNGASSGIIWGEWVRTVDRKDFNESNQRLLTELSKKASINIFENAELNAANADTYKATLSTEEGYKVITMGEDNYSSVLYRQKVDGKYISVGDTLVFSAEVFSDAVGNKSGDISLQALDSSGDVLTTSPLSNGSNAGAWSALSTTMTVPDTAVNIRLRFVRRLGNTIVKFRNPQLSSDSVSSTTIFPLAGSSSTTSSTSSVYVSKNGSDSNNGKMTTPYLTIQKAIDAVPDGGNVVVLDSAEYRETLTVDSHAHVKISAIAGNRVNIFGSDKLVVTKTSGMTKVYQAPLAAKPVGMGDARGKPAIFEWGTPSKPIPDDERHALQRGLTHRLPFAEMNEVATKAELDSVNGKWFWEAGIIYFTATDGSDARLKRYEARARPVLTHSNGTIELVRVSSWFSNSYAMVLTGLATKRTSCMAYGAYHNGFADNANFTESYRDISAANGNDGFNLTVSPSTLGRDEINNRIEGIYFDPYGHDNGDDGLSCHYRSDSTIYGGLFEHNTKGDVIHVTGSNSTCYGTESRGTANGFYTASDPVSDTVRVKTVMRCVGTKSTNNGYSYRAASNAELHLDDCVAITPSIMGYKQSGDDGVIRANNCKFDGDELKTKTGNVVVKNTNILTP